MAHPGETCIFSPTLVQHFIAWCTAVGCLMKPCFLHLLQRSTVRKSWQPYFLVAQRLNTFSKACIFVLDNLTIDSVYCLPLWHCPIFQKLHRRCDLAEHLVKTGILTVGHRTANQPQVPLEFAKLVGASWVRACENATKNFASHPISDSSRPTAWVHGWAKSRAVQSFVPSLHVP